MVETKIQLGSQWSIVHPRPIMRIPSRGFFLDGRLYGGIDPGPAALVGTNPCTSRLFALLWSYFLRPLFLTDHPLQQRFFLKRMYRRPIVAIAPFLTQEFLTFRRKNHERFTADC